MAPTSVLLIFIGTCTSITQVGAVLRTKSFNVALELETYSFTQFVREFDRHYAADEYQRRSALFDSALAKVKFIKTKNAQDGRSWTSGIHQFMDWTEVERKALLGYKPSRKHGMHGPAEFAALQTRIRGRSNLTLAASHYSGGGVAVRNQGSCGSCWAISAVEAVEAQLQQQGFDPSVRLSSQALVDCVPNPRHCGGTGGCDGATGELAYSFMRDVGIPLEADLPYDGSTSSCPVSTASPWPIARRAVVSGWTHLPSNQAQPLMEALVQQGPVAVAVDANPWFDYDSGVFDGCGKDAELDHAVLAKGYGEDSGKKYWVIQNSWGKNWGEAGHIRLHRHDDAESWCGTDKKPSEGEGCDGGPSEVTVCGMCGILYDPLVPTGARVEGDMARSGFDAGSAAAAGVEGVSAATTDDEKSYMDIMK